MTTINMTSCEVGGVISRANHVSIFSRPAGSICIEHPDFEGRFHDQCSLAHFEVLTMRLSRRVAAAAAPAKTPGRRTSGDL
jgi:hypothetical protein